MAVKCADVASWGRDRLGDLVVGPLQTWFLMLFFQVDRPDTGHLILVEKQWVCTLFGSLKYSPCSPFLTSEIPEDDLPQEGKRGYQGCFAISASHCKSEVGGIFFLGMQHFTSFHLFLHLGRK